MSTNDGVHRSATTGVTSSEHARLGVIGLSALLIALGFARRRSGDASPATGDRKPLEVGRGRSAETPSQIPARGWKDILLRVYHGISKNRILLVAAGVTFYSLLAIFPGIAALISIYGLFADPATVASHLDTIASVAPSGAIDVLREQMTRLASQGGTTLGVSFLIALPVALTYIPLPGVTALVVKIGRWPILFALVTLALAVLYKYGPSRTEPRWRWITWGSVSAAIVWLAASALFSWYVASFGSYNKTYGSLGAVVGFMTWIWISIIVVLLGAKLNAEMEHQTAHESTIGQPRPIGRRGARMADTVGAAQA